MIVLHGVTASPGFAIGQVVVFRVPTIEEIPRFTIAVSAVDTELRRFQSALSRATGDLARLEDRIAHELGQSESSIFDAHLALLQDQEFIDKVNARITAELMNVEQAVVTVIDEFIELLSSVQNEYLRERSADLLDVVGRVIGHLKYGETSHPLTKLPRGAIVVTHELLPSDTVSMDRKHIAGIVTERGGLNSHAAILARSIGIPAVTGVVDALVHMSDGAQLLIDGDRGTVAIEPSEVYTRRFESRKSRYDDQMRQVSDQESLECRTRDGVAVKLLANLSRTNEVDQVTEHYLQGIGLFRTEMLFMTCSSPPTLDRQHRSYRKVASLLGQLPLTLRTFDLGGDKRPAFLDLSQDATPFLGLRGLRFSLQERHLFRTQIRAILRTARDHDNVRILLPMVVGRHDLRNACDAIHELAEKENLSALPAIGAMIETPAALFDLDEIMVHVDFVSVGTNDLAQFMLAADREALHVMTYNPILDPAVLRAIRNIVKAGVNNDCPVCICGEAAGEPPIAMLLTGIGVREFSMSPVRASTVRYCLRQINIKDAAALARRALDAHSVDDIVAMVNKFCPNVPGKLPAV